nr:MAG TPA: hypothetical protein [Caudoviricetes sp.]
MLVYWSNYSHRNIANARAKYYRYRLEARRD